ncbi:MAG: GyrI-like domain-containing protein [Anaerolineaceae bacterium]|nr:GyrI-like domain-containing protein [Anaerolineaceae bacterium]
MAKIDYKKEFKSLYKAPDAPTLVDVPPLNYLMIDGQGDPNTAPVYSESVGTLYKLAYAIRFLMRDEYALDFGVMPLEGLWWVEDLDEFSYSDKSNWYWTMLIMQPAAVTAEIVAVAREKVVKKHNPPLLPQVRFDSLVEGRSAQVMHHGPYADEKPTIDRLHAFIESQGLTPHLKHHEIYLKDPTRCAPEKLLTILRHPVTAE